MIEPEILQSDNLRHFLNIYSEKYSLIKTNFISNAYARDVVNIPREELRTKKKKQETKDLLKCLNIEFLCLLQEKHKKNELEKINKYTYKVIKY